jgi:hypothetical protein
VALGAPWCTLCYADLRPPAEQASAPQPQPAYAGGGSAAFPGPAVVPSTPQPDPLTAAYDQLDLPASEAAPREPAASGPSAHTDLLPDPHLDAPIMKSSDIRLAEPGWPCRHCGTVVAMSEDNCPQCRTPFLVPEDVVDVSLPIVGNVRRLDSKMRTIVGIVGALGLMVVLVVLALIGGALL